MRKQWSSFLCLIIYLIALTFTLASSDRSDFLWILTWYGISFGAFVLLLKQHYFSSKQLFGIAFLGHLIAFLFMPQLSNDYFRFLWDGETYWRELNPYNYTPNQLIQFSNWKESPYVMELFSGMSDLSKANYTCYPTVNQWYFIFATSFTESVPVNTLMLRILIFCTQAGGIFYLWKLLKHFQFNPNRVFLLILNPIWLVETIGNLHFEGVMISFFIAGLYFAVRHKWILAGFLFAVAIQIKLIPLVVLPFLLRHFGWKRTIFIGAVTLPVVIGLFYVYLDRCNVHHFLGSIQLYFRNFEFNSLVYHLYLEYGLTVYGWYPNRTYGLNLSFWNLIAVLSLAFYGGETRFTTMMKRMTIAFFIYLFLSSTIHPWYLIPLLTFSLFTNYSFPLVWSGLAFLSYLAYTSASHGDVRLLIYVEYALLIDVIVYECIRKRPLLSIFSD